MDSREEYLRKGQQRVIDYLNQVEKAFDCDIDFGIVAVTVKERNEFKSVKNTNLNTK